MHRDSKIPINTDRAEMEESDMCQEQGGFLVLISVGLIPPAQRRQLPMCTPLSPPRKGYHMQKQSQSCGPYGLFTPQCASSMWLR